MIASYKLPATSNNLILHVNSTERNLVNSLKSGDQKAISILYTMYSPALMGIISRIIKFDEIAEDVLQETFVKIWKSIDQYQESKGKLFTWMARLARNTAIDQLRGRGYINSRKNSDLEDVFVEVDMNNQMVYNPETIGLKKLTMNLCAPQKAILDLIYFKGYSQSEVAQELNIPLGTVKTRLRMAIATLRKYF
ncbi:RNA polymerase sigma factor [Pedobacter sp. JCM 36344]|uniref:RNA polymerase sigma factor n=1 Tax=Pedobacter sp. JCM 36344 TaxID=3374280 RepID=UPI0039788B55